MSFKIGDVCEIVHGAKKVREDYVGLECVVTSLTSERAGCLSIEVAAKPSRNGLGYSAPPDNIRLKRLPDEYDGNKASDWALVTCWKPKRVEA